MLLTEIHKDIIYRNKLNPKLWEDNYHLHDKVRKKLIQIAIKFVKFANINPKFIKDVTITGSNCNYNYKDSSDIDLHVVCSHRELAKEFNDKLDVADFFKSKKELWNHEYKITILGIPVEAYIQDTMEARSSDDVAFSLRHNHWIKAPIRQNRNDIKSVDQKAINKIYRELRDEIKNLLKNAKSKKQVKAFKEKMRKIRAKGLTKNGGEFSIENLAFKKLRNKGWEAKLDDLSKEMNGKDLSLHAK